MTTTSSSLPPSSPARSATDAPERASEAAPPFVTPTVLAIIVLSGVLPFAVFLSANATVLVVGHSDTVPKIVQELGGPALPPLAATCFDAMFVIQMGGAQPKVVQTRYGAPTVC